ncbi:MAG TPA: hypothetical protein EYP59_12605 [Thiotrichaceae bacterium]|nr:hypothetical protein [Thiotrichaceae bacterium]
MFNLVKKSLLSLDLGSYVPFKIPEFQFTFNLDCSRKESHLQLNSEVNLVNSSQREVAESHREAGVQSQA